MFFDVVKRFFYETISSNTNTTLLFFFNVFSDFSRKNEEHTRKINKTILT